MNYKWTKILGVIGLIIGLVHPANSAFGASMLDAIAFAFPWAVFFALVGLAIDYFTRTKNINEDEVN